VQHFSQRINKQTKAKNDLFDTNDDDDDDDDDSDGNEKVPKLRE